jgi:hypothetical protein
VLAYVWLSFEVERVMRQTLCGWSEDIGRPLCSVGRHDRDTRPACAIVTFSAILIQFTCNWALAGAEAVVTRDSDDVPPNCKITAEFGAGYSALSSWETTISADGKVVQTYWDVDLERTVTKRLELRKEDVGKLRAVIQKSRFFDLEKQYSHTTEDQTTLVLKITVGGRTHCVKVYAPGKLRRNQDVKEFMKIWNEILRVVPDPNREVIESLRRR